MADFIFKILDMIQGFYTAINGFFGWTATIGGITFNAYWLLGGGGLLTVLALVIAKAITPFL